MDEFEQRRIDAIEKRLDDIEAWKKSRQKKNGLGQTAVDAEVPTPTSPEN